MPHNNYFQFKQFRVEQNYAAMRVGTDGVLLGAWAVVEKKTSILDIGTGTGVVALMLAQRSNAIIDAIDIEKGAIKDATYNFDHSPWKKRLQATQISLQELAAKTEKKYDSIVSNPPFFNNSKKPEHTDRLTARHTDSLSFTELVQCVAVLLTPAGMFNVILPAEEEKSFRNHAGNHQLFPTRITRIRPNPVKTPVRILMEFQFEGKLQAENELILETGTHHNYTPQFIKLIKPFYLYF